MAEAQLQTPPDDASPGEPEPEWEVARLFPPRGQWTETDYLALPDGQRVELSEGCLEFLSMPTEIHQRLLLFLLDALRAWVGPRALGEVLFAGLSVQLWPGKLRQPDLVFLRTENLHRRKGQYWEAADLVMEIVSPDPKDQARDRVVKRDEYARAGIAEYWIVEPQAERVIVLALEGESYRLHGEFGPGDDATSATLPGFAVPVSDLFASAAGTMPG